MSVLPSITTDLVKQYQEQTASSSSPATAKRRISSLRKFFDWAKSEGHIAENPLAQVETSELVPDELVEVKATKDIKPPRVSFGTILRFGGLAALVILLFLLADRLKFKIPLRFAFPFEQSTETPNLTGDLSGTGKSLTLSPWTIYTKLILQDDVESESEYVAVFKVYKNAGDTSPLWTSDEKVVNTGTDNSSLIALSGVPTELFFENNELYLAIEVGGQEIGERIQVPTANIATNLSGYIASIEGDANTIPVISGDGSLVLASETPSIKGTNGTLLVEGQAVTITTPVASDGDITINPDGSGSLNLIFEGTSGNQLSAVSSNLVSGNLIYGAVTNNTTNYNLINLSSGSTPQTQFSVDALGNTLVGGDLTADNIATGDVIRLTEDGKLTNITGYSQTSGNFSITQGGGDTASIIKKATALSDLLTLTLDERTKPSSKYSTLVLNRYDGAGDAYALFVDEGNARFDGQLQLGQYSSNPTSGIGEGALIYNTTSDSVLAWNGSSWTSVGTDSSTLDGLDSTQFLRSDTSDNYTSGTLTFDSGTTMDINGDLVVSDSNISFDAANTTLTATGDLTMVPGGGDVAITGDLDVSDQGAFGNAGAITSQQVINVNHVFTNTTGSSVGINVLNQVEPGSASSGNYYGVLSQARLDTAFNPNTIRGVGALATVNAAATVSNVQGIFTQANIQDAIGATVSTLNSIQVFADAEDATVTNSSSVRIEMPYVDTGTIGSGGTGAGYGINITDGVKGTGSIDIQYGLFLGSLANGNTNYGIWGNNGDWILDEDGDGIAGSTTSGGGNLILGEGQDLELYHDGTNSYIVNNTGTLNIAGLNGSSINFTDGSNTLSAVKDQGTYPYWNLAGKSDTGDPATCAEGDIYYNAFDDTLKICHSGNTWETVDGGAGSITLQSAYDTGNSINTSDARDVDIVLDDDTTDSNLDIDLTADNTVSISRIAGASAEAPNQLILLENLDSDITVPNGILFSVTNPGIITDAIDLSDADIDNALNLAANFLLFDGARVFEGTTGTLTFEDTGGNDLALFIDQGTTGRLAVSDSFQVGSTSTQAYSRLGTATTSHSGNLTASNDLLTSGDLEIDGVLYVDGGTISNSAGTATITFTATPTTSENTLSASSWLVENTANVGKAALMVNQTKDGDIFTASASGITKFTIGNTGTVSLSGTGIIKGDSTNSLRLQAGGTTTGSSGNSSVFFLDSTGTTRGRFDTATSGLSFGTSKDGNVEINSAKNLNTTTIATGRNFADGIAYRVTAPADSATTVTRHSGSVDLTNGIAVGDEVLLINLQGASGDTADVGNYEFMRVSAITASTITFPSAITKSFDGTTASNQKVVVQRVPNYDSVRVFASGSLTASAWDELATTPTGAAGYYTGIVAFRAGGTVTVESGGSISASNLGYQGYVGVDVLGPRQQGASYLGAGANSKSANGGGGGGGGVSSAFVDKGGGGGGGYAASGDAGTGNNAAYQGDGGGTYGSATLSTLFFGSGGGTSYNNSTAGDGGGIMFIAANTISSSGTIISNGQNGTTGTYCGVGGGAGGSIYLVGGNITIGTTTASGGTGSTGISSCVNANGGNASVGRIRIEYTGTLSGTTTPAASTATSITSGVKSPSLLSTSYGTLYTGAVNTSSADVAEHYPSKETLSPGEMVTFDPNNQLHIKRTTQAYDPTLAGIISTNPGVILGQGNSQTTTTYPIALSGRVPVNIATSSGEIRIGDFLTSSSDPGKAMKATKAGPVVARALENWKPEDGKSQIEVFVQLSYYFPEFDITESGNFEIRVKDTQASSDNQTEIGIYELVRITSTKAEEIVTNINYFAEFIAANIKAGAIETEELVSTTIKTKNLEAETISPAPNQNLTFDLNNSETATESAFGKLILKGKNSQEVASIDAEGNASFSGIVNSPKLITNELHAERIYADEIIAINGKFADLSSATSSAVTREEVEQMLKEAQEQASVLAQTGSWTVTSESGDLALDNLFVTGSAAVTDLSVTNSFTLGSDFVIQSAGQVGQEFNSINTLNKPLNIQSLAMAPIEMMAGKVAIDTNGDMVISGDLYVAGDINASGLLLKEDANATESGFAKLLALANKEGQEVSYITASGSAQFTDITTNKLIIAGNSYKTDSGLSGAIIQTNATAGGAEIPVGSREITINNSKVTDLTLVYVTPISPTQNKVLYVKSKDAGSFVVGFDEAIDIPVQFNWWIIDVINSGTIN